MPGPQGWAATSGYQTDADSGLMLLGNRYYDPTIGRFLSEDPAGDGDNWYAYCGNDPLGATDPTGLWIQNDSGGWDPQPGDDPSHPPDITTTENGDGTATVDTGTTRITGSSGYNPGDGDTGFGLGPIDTAVNQLEQDFENSTFGRALTSFNDALDYLGEGPHQAAAFQANGPMVFVRYGSTEEAADTLAAQKLLARPGHASPTNEKWIGKPGTINPKTLGRSQNYTTKMNIKTSPDAEEWLKINATLKSNEPGRFGIPNSKLDEFNDFIKMIEIEPIK